MNKIKNIIFDFDGVFYPYNGLGNGESMDEYFKLAYAAAANTTFPDNGFSMFPSYIDIGYEKFIAHISEYDHVDTSTYHLTSIALMHARFHENVLTSLGPEKQEILFSSVAQVKEDLHLLKDQGVNLAILSHSDKETWLDKILHPREMHGIFDYIVDYKSIGFNSKSASGHGLGYIMNMMNAKPRETLFVEDSARNIKMASQAYPELKNLFIASENIAEAHHYAPSLIDGMKQIMKMV